MHKLNTLIVIVLTFIVALFSFQNSETVEITFLFWGFETPRIFLVLALLFIGFILGQLAPKFFAMKKALTERAKNKNQV